MDRMVKIVINVGLLVFEGVVGMLFVGVMFRNKKLMVSMEREIVILIEFVRSRGCLLSWFNYMVVIKMKSVLVNFIVIVVRRMLDFFDMFVWLNIIGL